MTDWAAMAQAQDLRLTEDETQAITSILERLLRDLDEANRELTPGADYALSFRSLGVGR